jgi:hypothetical protein
MGHIPCQHVQNYTEYNMPAKVINWDGSYNMIKEGTVQIKGKT